MSANRRVNRTPRTIDDTRRVVQKLVSVKNRTTVGVDTVDYVVLDDEDKGVVLKSPNGHYWLVTINNSGALVSADLGTTKP